MDEFADLAWAAVKACGSPLCVALAIDADPREVYHWMAGDHLPEGERKALLAAALQDLISHN